MDTIATDAALQHPVSRQWTGYWQRAVARNIWFMQVRRSGMSGVEGRPEVNGREKPSIPCKYAAAGSLSFSQVKLNPQISSDFLCAPLISNRVTWRGQNGWHPTDNIWDRNAIIVEVLDNGPGIDRERLADVFEAFATTKPHGTGLGLAICRKIVERHEGQIWATSVVPHGAHFRIVLPWSS